MNFQDLIFSEIRFNEAIVISCNRYNLPYNLKRRLRIKIISVIGVSSELVRYEQNESNLAYFIIRCTEK